MKIRPFFLFFIFLSNLIACKDEDSMAMMYEFEKIDNTNNIKYQAGEIEGAVFQDVFHEGKWIKDNKYLVYDESSFSILKKKLYRCDKIINAWFQKDVKNPDVRDFLLESLFTIRRDTYLNKNDGQSINKLKRQYSLGLDEYGSGVVACQVFFASENESWFRRYPAFKTGIVEEANAFNFIFKVEKGQISLYMIDTV